MKNTGKTKLVTVGKLVKELKGYEKKYSDYNVVFWIPDGSTLCIVGSAPDKDGDLRIEIEEMDDFDVSGYYDVDILLSILAGYDKDTRVYLAGHGLYFRFDVNPDGSIFCDASEDDEIVGCYASAFGEYEYKQELAKDTGKKKRENRIYSIVLRIMAEATLVWLIYNVYALVTHSREYLWESILWVVVSFFVLVIEVLTLYHSSKK